MGNHEAERLLQLRLDFSIIVREFSMSASHIVLKHARILFMNTSKKSRYHHLYRVVVVHARHNVPWSKGKELR